ncbi:MAG: M3 family oligoendopeptidase [Oscillospiraceae bacterium]|jgi:M3 family oligoendopeptidase|nr:M3 family oligoendopeptidase [Oscillospiraceae bacterium]
MWEFPDLPYSRPDAEAVSLAYQSAIDAFAAAQSFAEANEAYLEQDRIIGAFYTAFTIASVRQTIDTTDAFYNGEMAFLNRADARLMPLRKRSLDALLATPFRDGFVAEYGEELFIKARTEALTQSEAIIQDAIEESDLKEEYKKIAASCSVEFKGQTRNFYGLLKFMEDPDRETRKAAFTEWAKLYENASDSLDDVYDKLIAIRRRMAQKLGFNSYIELAYASKGRVDYSAKDVESFREQVREVIVPAVWEYKKKQAKRVGVDKLRYYDENFMFPDGNADPVGGEDALLPIGRRMYRELSPETAEFFDFMLEHNLFDLNTRPGKHLGGYCTSLPDYKAPFIFSNFNGTASDVGVLTHEAGHAFAGYTAARSQPILAYGGSTSEINEIHSMGMEHFTYPWLKDLFGAEHAAKARFIHLCDAFSVVPYLVSVDEFQHRVFENPGMSRKERREAWSDIERTYLPWRDYDGNAFLEGGGFWMQKQHVFLYPFYYIDYALAQTCAFELYGRIKANPKQAWDDYLRLCRAGGSKGYFELLELANLSNPFKPGAVERAVGHVVEELNAAHEGFPEA